jgi:cytoskeletal protein CcmA (bactofilin family)
MFENWRFNPFTGTMNAATITDEPHTVEYHADWNAYGIQLDEAPQLDNPSSVSIVEDVSGGDTFSEVPRTQAPEALQYRVDYDALTYYGTGRIEFNAADVGKTVLVSYKGTGWTLKNRYSAGQTVIPANLEVTEDASIDGDLTLTGDNTGKGNLKVAGDADITGALEVTGGITGDVTGNLSGNVTGDVTGNLTGDVTGDVTGNADTATRADGIISGWVSAGQTWTRESNFTFSEPIDATAKYQVGDKIKWTDNSTIKYGVIAAVGSYSSGKTIMTIAVNDDYVIGTGGITLNYYSKIENPSGYPAFFDYTVTAAPSTGSFTTVGTDATYYTLGRMCFAKITVTIVTNGTGSGSVSVNLPIAPNVSSDYSTVVGHGWCENYGGATYTKMLVGKGGTGTTKYIVAYDGTYPGADARQLHIEFAYWF